MPGSTIHLALVWHMHQPSYAVARGRPALLPWVRLHAIKDYRDMVEILAGFSRVRCTFNLTPVLLDQLDRIAAGEGDEAMRIALVPAAELAGEDRERLLRDFFAVQRERMLEPWPRYRELRSRAHEEREGGPRMTDAECRDLQAWFHLAWVDPGYRGDEPIRSLLAKGRGFTEGEKRSLLAWSSALCGTVAEAYREAAASGRIEISASAHHHPILPLLADTDAPRSVSDSIALPDPPFRAPEDAAAQLRSARASFERRFGVAPDGTWPPEGAVSDAAISLIRDAGFTWAASDEAVLARALAHRDGGLRGWASARRRWYEARTPAGPLRMIFRDRELSDRIGFVYQGWDPEHAATDFVERVRAAGEEAGADSPGAPALVTVILDGENCWEGYEEDGRPFLRALYGALEADPSIEAVTVSEALERTPSGGALAHVPLGSWIRDDLAIWVGHPEKNRAWGALREAREALSAAGNGAPDEAWEALHAAEASDWLWWYGDDHASEQKDVFDALFRAHVSRVYEAIGREPPKSLRSSLRGGAEARARAGLGSGLEGAWSAARTHDAAAEGGAAHRVSRLVARVRHRIDGTDLRVRIELVPGAPRDEAWAALRFGHGSRSVVVPLVRGGGGALRWKEGITDPREIGDPGDFRADEDVEARIPIALANGGEGRELEWVLEVGRGESGEVEERVPATGVLATPVAES